jgi:hypothetical protein
MHWAVLAALTLATHQAAPGPADLVRSVTATLDAGRGDSLRAVLEARARRAPGDPAVQLALATVDRLSYRHTRAEARFLSLSRSGPPAWRVWGLVGLGASLAQRSDSGAVPVLWRAYALADSLGDAEAASHALLAQLRAVGRSLRPDSLTRLTALVRRLAPAADSGLTATALCADATARLRARNAAAADSLANQGIALARASRDRRAEARCLMISSQVFEARGQQLSAKRTLFQGLPVIPAPDRDLAATFHQQLAYQIASYTFALGDGREEAERAIADGRFSGNRIAVAYARLNLAQMAVRVSDFRAAQIQLDSARMIFEPVGDKAGLAARDFVVGDAAFMAGKVAEAERAYRSSLSRYSALGTPVLQVQLRLAMVALERRDLPRADSLLGLVGADAERYRLNGIRNDLIYYRALAALRRGRYAEAATEFRRYRAGVGAAARLYQMDAGLREAEALALAGSLEEAEAAADTAFAMLEEARAWLIEARPAESMETHRDLVMALASNRRYEFDPDLGAATIVDRLARGGHTAAAFRLADVERGRTLWVRLTRTGLLSRDSVPVGPRGEIRFPGALPADELRKSLDPATAIFMFTTGVGGEPTTLFVLERDRLRSYALPPADSLVEPIQRFADQIEGGAYPKAPARSLGQSLLGGALAGLSPGVTRLIVIPDGPLYRLPFDALLLSDGRTLLERFTVTLAPSARLAVEWFASSTPGRTGSVLAFGDPAVRPGSGLPRLPGSAREARTVAGTGGSVLLGAAASEARLKQADWTGVSVLHLAAHARTEEWGLLNAAVHLAPGSTEDGQFRPEEIAFTRIPVELVVLSGCRTTGGVVAFGEGIQGLVNPFLEAGARAVLATYWQVSDQRILPLVERFYTELRRGASAREALATAKRAVLAAGHPPAVWAAFALTGDGDVRPLAKAP